MNITPPAGPMRRDRSEKREFKKRPFVAGWLGHLRPLHPKPRPLSQWSLLGPSVRSQQCLAGEIVAWRLAAKGNLALINLSGVAPLEG